MLHIPLLLFASLVPAAAQLHSGSSAPASAYSALSDDRSWKIFGGVPAREAQFPFMVFIYYQKTTGKKDVHMCGGTLLNERFVLTAAHCTDAFGSGRVMVGSTTLDGPGQWSSIRRFMSHTGFPENPYLYHDIAIFEIDPVQLNYYVQPVRIVKRDAALLRKRKTTVIGFGTYNFTNMAPITSSYLRVTNVILFSHWECVEKKGEYISRSQLCAGDRYKGTGPGDSGGPLLVSTRDGLVQIGITSHGSSDIDEMMTKQHENPDVYVRVSKYCLWIAHKTEGEVNCQ
uniref:Peptidase S1 domain-containing protein n=1 Tax=Steinernema glaseri TaxID=37863 RepID=A0A1I7Y637_9BILA